jgi:hypothetical protein
MIVEQRHAGPFVLHASAEIVENKPRKTFDFGRDFRVSLPT